MPIIGERRSVEIGVQIALQQAFPRADSCLYAARLPLSFRRELGPHGSIAWHMNPPASVFISYRRADAAGHAGRLHDRLKSWFDSKELFYDLDSIETGDDFPERIRIAVSGAKVVLVLITPDWLAEINRRAFPTH